MDSREFREEDRKRMDASIQRLDERYLKIRNILGAIRHAANKDAANRVLNENLALENGDGLWQLTSQMLETLERFVAFDMKGLIATENGDRSELVIEADKQNPGITDSNVKQETENSNDLNEIGNSSKPDVPVNKKRVWKTLKVKRKSSKWTRTKTHTNRQSTPK